MRIDLNPSAMPELARSQGSAGSLKAGQEAAGIAAAQSDDVAELSTGSDAIHTLKTQLSKVPDIRQQRVAGLQQSISDGSFQISHRRIADAMLAAGDRPQH